MTESEADTIELPPVPEFGHGRPRWAAQRIHPRRLARGHLIQWARLRSWTIATGHPSPGTAIPRRVAGLTAVALLAWRTGHQQPQLLGIAAGAYALTAWRDGRPVPPTPPTEEELRRRVALGVQQLLGDDPAVFVRDVYDAFRARPAAAHLDDARIRAVLVHCGITIHRSVRVSATQTGRSGIKAEDIEALLSPTPVDTASEAVDAGQDATEEAADPA
ncbi:hypothetical protein ACIBKZ_18050 [Streptomyces sp. NPDC050421]|uniref:hypothetical protein n=1 Tax=Streptomyces sp. NPDC050421 TaxID=3365613 RepID=UPI0037AAEED4